jgi:hypothetical protein
MKRLMLLIWLLTIPGCDWLSVEFEEITREELNQLKCEWQEPKVSQWFYVGSEAGYHKFVHRDLPGDKHYEIKISALTIDQPMAMTSNEAKWKLMPWGPAYDSCKP